MLYRVLVVFLLSLAFEALVSPVAGILRAFRQLPVGKDHVEWVAFVDSTGKHYSFV